MVLGLIGNSVYFLLATWGVHYLRVFPCSGVQKFCVTKQHVGVRMLMIIVVMVGDITVYAHLYFYTCRRVLCVMLVSTHNIVNVNFKIDANMNSRQHS